MDIYAAIRAKCDELKCPSMSIGGMPDHVHLLVQLHTAVSVADLVKGVKGSSSHLVTHMIEPGELFKWQGGYGAFTLAKDDISTVAAYIERQKQHHSSGNLLDEWEQTQTENSDE
jgi:REP element-mobilizing transposase RayT